MTFWCGSGSGDPCLGLMDPGPDSDPDPAIFVTDLQVPTKNNFLTLLFLLVTFSMIQGFLLFLHDRRIGSGSRAGSIPLTSGSESGSGRPKNTWIRWIRNTAWRNIIHIRLADFSLNIIQKLNSRHNIITTTLYTIFGPRQNYLKMQGKNNLPRIF
jgi:hypothetical protein